jgi:hypothetical protein
MNDTPVNDTVPEATPHRPSIALTTPFLSLAAAVIALAAFLLGYVVKDLASDHGRPHVSIARMDGPAGLERGRNGGPALPPRGLDNVTAGTVTSVDGNTVTLKGPNGKTVKVTLDKDAFVVVRTVEGK